MMCILTQISKENKWFEYDKAFMVANKDAEAKSKSEIQLKHTSAWLDNNAFLSMCTLKMFEHLKLKCANPSVDVECKNV